MENLSQEQTAAVAGWFAAGASLDEIQKRIQGEFGIHLTYLDVRLMVAELPQPVEPEKAEDGLREDRVEGDSPAADGDPEDFENESVQDALPRGDSSGAAASEDFIPPAEDGETAPAGELEVSVDPLTPPGCIACGGVTFSDGNSGKWMLDQMGRLGLSGLPQGYRPSPEDSAQFQPKLVAALRARGLM